MVVSLEAGASEAYERHSVSAGRRDGQFKVQVVQYRDEDDFNWLPFVSSFGSIRA